MDIEKRMDLITREPVEEVITREDLKNLLETKSRPTAYDGFEPSGLLHLGSGILRAMKIKDLLDANVGFILWVADWFGWINNKMGGDLEKLKIAGQYSVEAWKACGVDTKKVKVLWTSDAVSDPEYWKGVIEVAKNTTVTRAVRAGTIMGRAESEMQHVAQLMYPMMQAFDPFYIGADILQLGMDQRKVMVLSREVASKLGKPAPVVVAHHLLAGLTGSRMDSVGVSEIELKMSKSKPKGTIFIHDSKPEIEDKIKSAYCPDKMTEGNPILELWKYIIFKKFSKCTFERPAKFGGRLEIQNYSELEKIFKSGKLHPLDLKKGTVEALDTILKPVRAHFEKDRNAARLLEQVKGFGVTR